MSQTETQRPLPQARGVNLLKVNNTMHQQCGRYNFTESLAQSDRVSSWLWSVANNPNPSELEAQDYKALQLTTHPTTPHPNVLRILSEVLAYLPRGELRLKPPDLRLL